MFRVLASFIDSFLYSGSAKKDIWVAGYDCDIYIA